MTDIVERLHNLGWETCHEAADEIVRLREELWAVLGYVEELRAEIERAAFAHSRNSEP